MPEKPKIETVLVMKQQWKCKKCRRERTWGLGLPTRLRDYALLTCPCSPGEHVRHTYERCIRVVAEYPMPTEESDGGKERGSELEPVVL